MKNFVPLFIFLSILFVGCQQKPKETKLPPVLVQNNGLKTEANTTAEMTIEGMMCAIGCAAAIEKKLNATAGVSSATVDFDSKTALVHFDQKRISGIQIQEVVTQVGKQYKVKEYTEQ